MNRILFFFLGLFFFTNGNAQRLTVGQLRDKLVKHNKQDMEKVDLINKLARRSELQQTERDSLINESLSLSRRLQYFGGESYAVSIKAQFIGDVSQATVLSKQALGIAQKSNDEAALFWAYRSLGQSMLNTSENKKAIDPFNLALQHAESSGNPELIIYGQLAFVDYYRGTIGNYPLALEWGLKALQTAEQFHDKDDVPNIYRNIGAVYLLIGDQEKSLSNLQKAINASKKIGDFETAQYALNDMGEQYRLKGRYKEALEAYGQAFSLIKDSFNIELNQSNVADVYQRMGNDALCFAYAFRSLSGAKNLKDTIGISWINNILSRSYLHTGKTDSALYYGMEGYNYALKTQVPEYIRDNSEALANAFNADKNFDKAFSYYKIFISTRDSMLNNETTNKIHLAQFNYDLEKKQAEIAVLNKDKQLQHYLFIGTVAVLLFIVVSLVILYRNNNKRKKAYAQLHEQKQEIQAQRDQTNEALNNLKLTQNQLIQSEKMASLGELTAGIAHEIQNPLNFVNNFSEVSNELIDEMNDEINKGNTEEAKVIARDVKQNLEKINFHGKRADAIVKGMLQHSRTSTGQKEPTDINALADEYLRLAYHGLRAKDKSFNAKFETDFDPAIGVINIIPQDIGRVILNLITNAFYAVAEKKVQHPNDYEPCVTVSTKKINTRPGCEADRDRVEIRVSDNANGIPSKVLDKIFQPFFTTKPTGQGTGLGLSMSYDIVTKGHGGELKVETTEGKGSVFIISLNT